jgi:hypothetical protein
MNLFGLFLALLSALSFGLGNVYWKVTMSDDLFPRVVFFRGLLALILMMLIATILKNVYPQNELTYISQLTGKELASYMLLFLSCSLGIVFYLKSLEFEQVMVSIPLSTINIFSILTSVIILGETFKPSYYLLFTLSGTGVYLILSNHGVSKKLWNKGAVYALLASIVWGCSYPLFKYPASKMGALTMAIMVEACVCTTAFCWYCATANWRNLFSGIEQKQLKHYAVLAIVLIIGTMGYNMAIQRIDMIVLNITGKLTFLTSISLGILLLKEKIDTKKAVGMLFILASLILAKN